MPTKVEKEATNRSRLRKRMLRTVTPGHLQKSLTETTYVKKARERVWEHLHATQIKSIKLSRLREVPTASAEALDELFGPGNWVQHMDRLIFIEDNFEAQMAAVREIMSRAEPQLNRSEANALKAFKVFRTDPNTVTLEEVDPKAELPPGGHRPVLPSAIVEAAEGAVEATVEDPKNEDG